MRSRAASISAQKPARVTNSGLWAGLGPSSFFASRNAEPIAPTMAAQPSLALGCPCSNARRSKPTASSSSIAAPRVARPSPAPPRGGHEGRSPVTFDNDKGAVDDGIWGCAEENWALLGHIAGVRTAGATGCAAATSLPATLAESCARFRPSDALAPPVGPSEPTTSRTMHVNAPLTTTRAPHRMPGITFGAPQPPLAGRIMGDPWERLPPSGGTRNPGEHAQAAGLAVWGCDWIRLNPVCMRLPPFHLGAFPLVCTALAASAQVRITEFMASNTQTLYDEASVPPTFASSAWRTSDCLCSGR